MAHCVVLALLATTTLHVESHQLSAAESLLHPLLKWPLSPYRRTWRTDSQRFDEAKRKLFEEETGDASTSSFHPTGDGTASKLLHSLVGLHYAVLDFARPVTLGNYMFGASPAAHVTEAVAELRGLAEHGHAPAIALLSTVRLFGLRGHAPNIPLPLPAVLLNVTMLATGTYQFLPPSKADPGCSRLFHFTDQPVAFTTRPESFVRLGFSDASEAIISLAAAACMAQTEMSILSLHARALDEGGDVGLAAAVAVNSPLLDLVPLASVVRVREALNARGITVDLAAAQGPSRDDNHERPVRGDFRRGQPWAVDVSSILREHWQSWDLENSYSGASFRHWLRNDVWLPELKQVADCFDSTVSLLAILHLSRFRVEPLALAAHAAVLNNSSLNASSLTTLYQPATPARTDEAQPFTVFEWCLRRLTPLRHWVVAQLRRSLLALGRALGLGQWATLVPFLRASSPAPSIEPQALAPSVPMFPSDSAAWGVLALLADRGEPVSALLIANSYVRRWISVGISSGSGSSSGYGRDPLDDAHCARAVNLILPMASDAANDQSIASLSHPESSFPALWEAHEDAYVLTAAAEDGDNIEYLQQQAEAGDPDAQLGMADLLLYGYPPANLLPDIAEAERLLGAAAAAGLPEAMARYAMVIVDRVAGEGGEEDRNRDGGGDDDDDDEEEEKDVGGSGAAQHRHTSGSRIDARVTREEHAVAAAVAAAAAGAAAAHGGHGARGVDAAAEPHHGGQHGAGVGIGFGGRGGDARAAAAAAADAAGHGGDEFAPAAAAAQHPAPGHLPHGANDEAEQHDNARQQSHASGAPRPRRPTRSRSLSRNLTLAREYLDTAAAEGLPSAFAGLGFLYQTGTGVPRNLTAAMEHLQHAAELGYESAHFNIATLYLMNAPNDGRGSTAAYEGDDDDEEEEGDDAIPFNATKAREHLLLAQQSGEFAAVAFNLGLIDYNGWDAAAGGGVPNCRSALEHWLPIAERGRWVETAPFSLESAFEAFRSRTREGWTHAARQYRLLALIGGPGAADNAAFLIDGGASVNDLDMARVLRDAAILDFTRGGSDVSSGDAAASVPHPTHVFAAADLVEHVPYLSDPVLSAFLWRDHFVASSVPVQLPVDPRPQVEVAAERPHGEARTQVEVGVDGSVTSSAAAPSGTAPLTESSAAELEVRDSSGQQGTTGTSAEVQVGVDGADAAPPTPAAPRRPLSPRLQSYLLYASAAALNASRAMHRLGDCYSDGWAGVPFCEDSDDSVVVTGISEGGVGGDGSAASGGAIHHNNRPRAGPHDDGSPDSLQLDSDGRNTPHTQDAAAAAHADAEAGIGAANSDAASPRAASTSTSINAASPRAAAALYWYSRASDLHFAHSMLAMARGYASGRLGTAYLGARNVTRAWELLERVPLTDALGEWPARVGQVMIVTEWAWDITAGALLRWIISVRVVSGDVAAPSTARSELLDVAHAAWQCLIEWPAADDAAPETSTTDDGRRDEAESSSSHHTQRSSYSTASEAEEQRRQQQRDDEYNYGDMLGPLFGTPHPTPVLSPAEELAQLRHARRFSLGPASVTRQERVLCSVVVRSLTSAAGVASLFVALVVWLFFAPVAAAGGQQARNDDAPPRAAAAAAATPAGDNDVAATTPVTSSISCTTATTTTAATTAVIAQADVAPEIEVPPAAAAGGTTAINYVAPSALQQTPSFSSQAAATEDSSQAAATEDNVPAVAHVISDGLSGVEVLPAGTDGAAATTTQNAAVLIECSDVAMDTASTSASPTAVHAAAPPLSARDAATDHEEALRRQSDVRMLLRRANEERAERAMAAATAAAADNGAGSTAGSASLPATTTARGRIGGDARM